MKLPPPYADSQNEGKPAQYVLPERFRREEPVYGIHLWNKSWTDELALLAKGEYKEGFRLVGKRIRRTPLLPWKYYKKVMKYLIYYAVGKNRE